MRRQEMTAPDDLCFGPDDDPDTYELNYPLGWGGEGQVYEAAVLVEGRRVRRAVKVYRAPLDENPAEFARKAKEWQAQLHIVQSLTNHPTIARVYQVFIGQAPHRAGETVAGRALYMLMEWVDGLNLAMWVANNPDRDFAQSLQLVQQAAAGLDYMHSGLDTDRNPIIHRDVKPTNLMVQSDGNLRIVDLGQARGADQAPIPGGTPGYWAPEAVRPGEFSERSDLYSLAATTYFLFTGTHPVDHPDLAAMHRQLAETPTGLALPRFPDALLAGMAPDPAARPESVQAWVAELSGAGSSTVPPRGPLPPPAPRSLPGTGLTTIGRRRRLTSWATAGALLLAIGGYLTMGRDEVPSERADGTVADPADANQTSSTFPSPSTTTTLPPPGPVEEFLGVWHGESVGDDDSVPLTLVVDQPRAAAAGDGVGRFGYNQCRGPLRLVAVDDTALTVTPVSSDPACHFDGEATLTRSGETASYEWASADGTSSRFGTFERSSAITLDKDFGWPTESNDLGSAFYAYLGACMAGSSPPCPPSGRTPDWTSCSGEFCIAGGDGNGVDVYRDLEWLLELPATPPNTAIELLMAGFTEVQVFELLDV